LDPDLRNALLLLGLIFCGFFAVVTIYVIVDTGLSLQTYGDLGAIVLYGVSLLVIVLIASGLIGALRNPPDD
jgi:peptidoglycan/LPS O-acetylase OafA/YrhL